MARTRSLAWSQLKIGILGVAALALATMLILAVGGQGGFSWERYALKTKFTDVKGLKSGAVVRIAGVDVGKVTDVEFVRDEVEVTLEVNDSHQQRITDQSRAMIGSLSLLGEPIIDVTPSSQGRPLQEWEYIPSTRAPGQIAEVTEQASQSLEQLTGLMKDVRAGKGSVGKFVTEDELYREITALVSNAEVVASNLRSGRGSLGMMLNDPAAYKQMNQALANIQETTRRINAGEGSLGKLLNDDALAKSLSSASGNVDQILGGLRRGDGTAGKLLTDQQLYDRFNALTGRIDKVITNLEAGQGTAGALLQDKQLYENMNTTVSEVRALIAEIRKDPKKYLNVRVSIF
jgi:phospholipid/cholesterol/gamma-HCH transport system substrate-binding protein